MRPFVFAHLVSMVVSCGLLTGGAVADAPPVSLHEAWGACDNECEFCWCGTDFEMHCPEQWLYDHECDCGCQFCDPDCPNCDIQVCCAVPGDFTRDALVDLEDHSLLPACLLGPGGGVSAICTCADLDDDGDVDLRDVAGCQVAFGGS